jgi:hypothetical protein
MLLLLGGLLSACAGRAPSADSAASANRAPRQVATSLAQALEKNDPRAAYALLAAPTRKTVTYDAFLRDWNASPLERAQQAKALTTAATSETALRQRAEVTLADKKTILLVHQTEGWRLDAPLVSSRRAGTPHDALRMLVIALEDRSFEGLMRVLRQDKRRTISETLDAFVTGLKTHLGDEIEVSDNQAILQWSDGKNRFRVYLVREDGEWRIDRVVF